MLHVPSMSQPSLRTRPVAFEAIPRVLTFWLLTNAALAACAGKVAPEGDDVNPSEPSASVGGASGSGATSGIPSAVGRSEPVDAGGFIQPGVGAIFATGAFESRDAAPASRDGQASGDGLPDDACFDSNRYWRSVVKGCQVDADCTTQTSYGCCGNYVYGVSKAWAARGIVCLPSDEESSCLPNRLCGNLTRSESGGGNGPASVHCIEMANGKGCYTTSL